MRLRQVSILAAVLAVGCAHGKSEAETAKAGDGTKAGERAEKRAEKREERREERREEQAARADEVPERVQMPDEPRANRDRLANAGGELPESKRREGQPPEAATYGTSPDNTRVNERDREGSALTPLDQKENENDLKITQRIRKTVVADDSLSFTAKNVKIITRDGQVTLRGSVKNANEKTLIEKAARDVAGPTKVTNELEIAN